ncbi:ECF transporter S component [Pontibacillus yanchengensis]|uniref:ECF transporter S component n=2 Tax=Pontibacillus yanchengensis TaxID=462910 RepID=A0A6I5A3L3_9BACI|nr:ECF transporter S component [Pontibacillus yanchengensis]MYL34381.1 ECF transporter S component [Pontibacillus yanchengensis]MYL53849.1 ECF transporter S component [Pontibacillus yanchengensis]
MGKNKSFIVAMIPAGIALNWVANSIVEMLKLPLFLNNIGTVLNAIVIGPVWGAVTALMTNVILALIVRWTYIPFALVGMVVAFLAYFFFKKGWYQKGWKVIVSGAVTGVVASAIATVISVYVFGGFSGHTVDVLTAGLIASGQEIFNAAFIANMPGTMADKILTFWIVWMILKMFPVRYLPNAKEIKNKIGTTKKKSDDKKISA